MNLLGIHSNGSCAIVQGAGCIRILEEDWMRQKRTKANTDVENKRIKLIYRSITQNRLFDEVENQGNEKCPDDLLKRWNKRAKKNSTPGFSRLPVRMK
jgi:hypothetical protein